MAIQHQPVEYLAAFRFEDGAWQQVPLQIDERNARGDYVLNDGLPFTAHSDDLVFDGNDEIVFWGADFGEDFKDIDVDAGIWRKAYDGWKVALMIDDRPVGFLLVVRLKSIDTQKWPHSVTFDPEAFVVDTPGYRYAFRREHAALLGDVYLRTAGGLRRVFRESHFVMNLHLPWYLPDFSLDQDNFNSTVESWKIGPLRAIVAVGVKFSGFLSLFNLHLFSEISFSHNGLRIPTIIEFPIDPTAYFKPGTGLAYGLSFDKGLQWQLDSNLEPLPHKQPAELFKSGLRASAFSHFYAVGRSEASHVVVNVVVDKKAAEVSLPPMLLLRGRDRQGLQKYWRWVEKFDDDLAVFVDISGVPKGSYDFGLDLYLSADANENIIAKVDSLRTQWSVVTTQLKKESIPN